MINYNVDSPQALKTIEQKMRQMQATGQNITPEMMNALYESVLEVGADKASRMAEIEANTKIAASNQVAQDKRFDKAAKIRQEEGIGSAAGKMALYGGKYANKQGWFDPIKKMWEGEPPAGGTTTPEPLKTPLGQDVSSPELGMTTRPTLMPEGNPLAGAGDITGLELSPEAGGVLPGPITTPPPVEPITGIAGEFLGETAPTVMEGATPVVAELGTETLAETAPAVVETGTSAAGPSMLGSMAGPAGFGAMGSGMLDVFGVKDDVGKAILFGQGGEKEQNIAGGVVGGAATGAAAGTFIFPGVGTAVGAILGGIMGGVSSALKDLF